MIGTVAGLWRYPVKSMLGERRESLLLERRGVVGDRLYAIRDEAGKFGSGKTTRRFRLMDGLYRFRSYYDGATPVITFPEGVTLSGDDPAIHARLSDALGINVQLSRESDISHFDDGPIHLVTTASLRALGALLAQDEIQQETDARRFRPNIVIETSGEGFQEDSWEGREILLGDQVRLRVTKQAERCVMVNFAWDELREEPQALRTLAQAHDACLGVYADVLAPGILRNGDSIRFADEA
jgi:MOSC domain-containing protein